MECKLLVLGANGMVGHTIAHHFLQKGADLHTITRRPLNVGKNKILHVENFKELEVYIIKHQFDVIINCVGLLNSNADNQKYLAIKLNSLLPHFLVEITKDSKTKIIHLSTDCVFSGKEGKYTEDSIKDGYTFYDQSKSLGEIVDNKNLTFRNSLIGPDMDCEGIGLFNWFMKQTDNLEGYGHVIWNGVTSIVMARAIEKAIKDNLTGIYHLVSEPITKYELLTKFNMHFFNNELKIYENVQINSNKSLVNTRMDFDFEVSNYDEMLVEMKNWIISNPDLYPHYKVKV